MDFDQTREALQGLTPVERKQLLLELFPDVAREALQDPAFLMQLLPLFLKTLNDHGLDLQQLTRLAGLFSPSTPDPSAR